MATTHDLDPSRYLRGPMLDTAGALGLGIAMLTAHAKVGEQLPDPVKQTAKILRTALKELQSRWAGQRVAALATAEDKRPADLREDRAFRAIALRLEGLTLLPATKPISQRAEKLFQHLFPNGLSFLKLPYERQWAECEQRVRDIATRELTAELNELVGEDVVAELHDAHRNYGRALGITSAREGAAPVPKLADQLRAVREATGDYTFQLLAAARFDEDVVPAVLACLRPLDELREAETRRRAGGALGAAAEAAAESEADTTNAIATSAIPPLESL